MQHREINFVAGVETLHGTLDIAENDVLPRVLSLHGAGPSNRARARYITEYLAQNGISSVRFDFSGHGNSSGQLKDSTLAKRLNEARAAVKFLDKHALSPKTLIGTSMGGHVAARLTAELTIANLILFCPAAYAAEAEELPFGSGFTEVIRRPNSFNTSLVFECLRTFSGNLLIVFGDADEIIPGPIVEHFLSSAAQANTRVLLRIKNAPHQIHGWLNKNDEQKKLVLRQILSLIS